MTSHVYFYLSVFTSDVTCIFLPQFCFTNDVTCIFSTSVLEVQNVVFLLEVLYLFCEYYKLPYKSHLSFFFLAFFVSFSYCHFFTFCISLFFVFSFFFSLSLFYFLSFSLSSFFRSSFFSLSFFYVLYFCISFFFVLFFLT